MFDILNFSLLFSEWVYGLRQYRFFNEILTFEQAKGRCKEPNSRMHFGEDFPSMVFAWISSDWNMVTFKWGVGRNLKFNRTVVNQ